MATDVSDFSCRAILLFAMKREVGPLVARPEMQPAWLEESQVFAFLRTLPDPADVIEPTADDVIFDFTGVGIAAATRTLERILNHFPRPGIVIAAGYCGALKSKYAVGDVVVPSDVVDETGLSWRCQPLPEFPQDGRLFTASHIIGEPQAKADASSRFKADIVDMESAAIAKLCAERGISFAVIRAISDTSDTALSPHLARLLSGGEVSIWRACRALARRPSLLREFLRLARDTKLAARNLAAALVKVIGPA